MSRQSRLGTVAIMTLFLATLGPSSVGAAPPTGGASALPGGAMDITGTARGKRLIAKAADRYAANGAKAQPLRAIEDDGGILIAPENTRFGTVEVTLAGGQKGIALAPLTPDAPAPQTGARAGDIGASAGPTWTFQGNQCFSRISDTWSWLDHCYYMYRLSNDGNASYDWFALAHYASMKANVPWVMNWARIRAYRHGGSAQTWADWSPKSDWNGGSCGTISVAVTLPVGGIGISTERCPQLWDFTKSANGTSPDYSLRWIGLGTRATRELTFEIAVRVAQGGWAQWALPAEVHGSAF